MGLSKIFSRENLATDMVNISLGLEKYRVK